MKSFRSLVIDLLDDADGITEANFRSLMEFAVLNYTDMCNDVFSAVEGGQGRIYLNEDVAEELRRNSEPTVTVDFADENVAR